MQSQFLWTEKYRPQSLSEISHLTNIISELKSFIIKFDILKRKKTQLKTNDIAMLLLGDPGTGKTTLIHLIGKDLDYEVIEVNASDSRNKKNISELIGSTQHVSFFSTDKKKQKKLLFIDEVDGIAGVEDKGGLKELLDNLFKCPYPIFLAANYENEKIEILKKNCTILSIPNPSVYTIISILKKIAQSERIKYDDEVIKKIAENANGDIRAAINDLQFNSSKYMDSSLSLFQRTLFYSNSEKLLLDIINASNLNESLEYAQNHNSFSYYEILKYIGDTILSQKNISLKEFECIHMANSFLQYIMSESQYSLLRYFFLFISSICVYRENQNAILNLSKPFWRKKRKESNIIIKKIQKYFPLNTNEIYTKIIPLLYKIISNDNVFKEEILNMLTITDDEWKKITETIK